LYFYPRGIKNFEFPRWNHALSSWTTLQSDSALGKQGDPLYFQPNVSVPPSRPRASKTRRLLTWEARPYPCEHCNCIVSNFARCSTLRTSDQSSLGANSSARRKHQLKFQFKWATNFCQRFAQLPGLSHFHRENNSDFDL
jgi:hypothetical protein